MSKPREIEIPANLLNPVRKFFNGDENKALLWFRVENPMLGGVSPVTMIRMGREKRLLQFIEGAIAENQNGQEEKDHS